MSITVGPNTTPDAIYELILWFLEKGPNSKGVVAETMLCMNIERFKTRISWDLSEENLKLLDRCVHDNKSLDDDTWTETRNEFIVAAFKDLSTFRNPKAMEIFRRLRTICTMDDGELLVWGRKVTTRSDGSAVMVIHVSNLEVFEKMLRREHGHGFLQEGLMIYR